MLRQRKAAGQIDEDQFDEIETEESDRGEHLMAITSANQLELLQTAEAVAREKNDRPCVGH